MQRLASILSSGTYGQEHERIVCISAKCRVRYYVARANRPTQQTFCCGVCGHTTPAAVHAAAHLARRLHDQELAACVDRQAMKALLAQRHQGWQQTHGWP